MEITVLLLVNLVELLNIMVFAECYYQCNDWHWPEIHLLKSYYSYKSLKNKCNDFIVTTSMNSLTKLMPNLIRLFPLSTDGTDTPFHMMGQLLHNNNNNSLISRLTLSASYCLQRLE
jgi:hypothetical protein